MLQKSLPGSKPSHLYGNGHYRLLGLVNPTFSNVMTDHKQASHANKANTSELEGLIWLEPAAEQLTGHSCMQYRLPDQYTTSLSVKTHTSDFRETVSMCYFMSQ